MEKNFLKIEREVEGVEKLGGERKKIIVHGTPKIKCFLKFHRDTSTYTYEKDEK